MIRALLAYMLTRCPGCGAYTWDGEHHCNGGKK